MDRPDARDRLIDQLRGEIERLEETLAVAADREAEQVEEKARLDKKVDRLTDELERRDAAGEEAARRPRAIGRSLGGTPVYVTRWWGREFVRCSSGAQ
jgi:septal ring factor EnvC (AmiA/AmiB activator)